ncbi:hypothetical protein V8B97DRAFT_13831 [Scleroderma yunnanense]
MDIANTTSVDPVQVEPELPFTRFPPFPNPPEGVTIMPFKDFKPRGIQLFAQLKRSDNGDEDDDVELDGLGIPTLELRVKHTTDECKSNKRKKRKKKHTDSATPGAPAKKLPWYEEWEEGEDLRVIKGSYDTSIQASDRLFQAAMDFRTGRPWPPVASGLNNIWDQFRIFVGLLINPTVYRKDEAKSGERDAFPDSDSEDEGLTSGVVSATDLNSQGSSRLSKDRPRPCDPSAVEKGDEDEDELFDPQKIDEETKEEKLMIFLKDPEKSVRIFLSSYMREKGLIWSERNLTYAPHLLSFFIGFLLRSRVFPEQTYQRRLKRALETIQQAKKELPLTHKVGHIVPDQFNEACKEIFGRKGSVNWTSVTITEEQLQEQKLTVTDTSIGMQEDITLPSEEQTIVKEAIEDNIDFDVNMAQVNGSSFDAGWGNYGAATATDESGWSGWNSTDGQPFSWDTSTDNQPAEDAEYDGSLAPWPDSAPTWGRELPSLMTFLGPTVLPLTHTTGIVECSTRRVREVHPPATVSSNPSSGKRCGKRKRGNAEEPWVPSASGVEAELDAKFAKVVLTPWGFEGGDISKPEIWETSRGSVIDPNSTSGSTSDSTGGDGKQKPHNPLTDDIVLLVQPHLLDTFALVPGLGLGAMWIQLARTENAEKGGRSELQCTKTFWYHEDLTGIFPSFYTPGT